MRQLRYDEAVTLLTEVVGHDPGFAPALYDLALCYLAMGQTSDALLVSSLLRRESERWYKRLERVQGNDLLRPRVVPEMPRLPIKL